MQENVLLSEYTTFRVGGPARYFFSVSSEDDLKMTSLFIKEKNCPYFFLGGGSNVLFQDSGFQGVVLNNNLKGIEYEETADGVCAIVASGEEWDSFVEETVDRGLYGLENLSGIPGTVGGSPIQNIGAYGVEVSETIDWVEVIDIDTLKARRISNKECEFGYRASIFKNRATKDQFITKVCFKLKKDGVLRIDYKDIALAIERGELRANDQKELRKVILNIRSKKFPNLAEFGTAGSFFKNPIVSKKVYDDLKSVYHALPMYPVSESAVKIPIAWFIEYFGWKGKCMGNVCTYKQHSLVVVQKNATQKEIVSFVEAVAKEIKEKTNIDIVPEVTLV